MTRNEATSSSRLEDARECENAKEGISSDTALSTNSKNTGM